MPAPIKRLLLALPLLALPQPAAAVLCGTALDPISVSATTLAFGNYYPSAASTNTTTVGINCGLLGVDLLPAFTVSLSAGNAGTPASRYMLQSATHLNYNIYTTLGYSKVWGDGTAGSLTQSYGGLLSIGTISFTGYGQLPAGQYVTPGSYSDTITVTVSF